jgi:hypothetical protein
MLRDEAVQYASPSWSVDFYDTVAKHIPNYVPSARRGTWKASIRLPDSAEKPIAVLSQNGVGYQDNIIGPLTVSAIEADESHGTNADSGILLVPVLGRDQKRQCRDWPGSSRHVSRDIVRGRHLW